MERELRQQWGFVIAAYVQTILLAILVLSLMDREPGWLGYVGEGLLVGVITAIVVCGLLHCRATSWLACGLIMYGFFVMAASSRWQRADDIVEYVIAFTLGTALALSGVFRLRGPSRGLCGVALLQAAFAWYGIIGGIIAMTAGDWRWVWMYWHLR